MENTLIYLIVLLAVVLLVGKLVPNTKQGYHGGYNIFSQPADKIESDQLIGLMYPPRAGPLHTNFQFPKKREKCPRPFTAIFKQEPFLRAYNQLPPSCVV